MGSSSPKGEHKYIYIHKIELPPPRLGAQQMVLNHGNQIILAIPSDQNPLAFSHIQCSYYGYLAIWETTNAHKRTITTTSPPESVYFQMSPHSLSSFLLSIGLLQDVNAERIQSTSPRDPKRRSLPTSPSQPRPGLAEEVGRCSTWNILKLLTYTYPQVSKP